MARLVRLLIRLILFAWVATFVAALVAAARAKRDAPPRPEPDADEIELTAIFEQVDFVSTAQQFAGGRLECMFGGGIVDLRGATLAPTGARFQIRTVFGGVQLVVPPEWRVETQVLPIMGGVGDARGAVDRPLGAPRIVIEGLAVFGGIGITSEVWQRADGNYGRGGRRFGWRVAE